MKLIKPYVEVWLNHDNIEHVARCARVCYASKLAPRPTVTVDNLKKNGHLSMFRHETHYFKMPLKELPKGLDHNPLVTVVKEKPVNKRGQWLEAVAYVSCNGQWAMENATLISKWRHAGYSVDESVLKGTMGEGVIRRTFCVVTQISTSRELNRVSPNNIAEQSTRYVNFGKKGGVTICVPHWYDRANWFVKFMARLGWRLSIGFYNLMLKLKYPPQDAREFLPLTTATKCIYTYSIKEWKHILDLRYHGTTGKPHPNAYEVAKQIYDALNEEGFGKWITNVTGK